MTDFEIAYLVFCIMGFIVFAGTLAIETHLSGPPHRSSAAARPNAAAKSSAATRPSAAREKKSPTHA